jgi:hypothetical protein
MSQQKLLEDAVHTMFKDEELIKRLVVELRDAASQLEHFARGRRRNWDGSTERQALVTVERALALIAEIERNQ